MPHVARSRCKFVVLSVENLEHLIHALLKVLKGGRLNPESRIQKRKSRFQIRGPPKNLGVYLPAKLNQMRNRKKGTPIRTHVMCVPGPFCAPLPFVFFCSFDFGRAKQAAYPSARTRTKRKMLITLCV